MIGSNAWWKSWTSITGYQNNMFIWLNYSKSVCVVYTYIKLFFFFWCSHFLQKIRKITGPLFDRLSTWIQGRHPRWRSLSRRLLIFPNFYYFFLIFTIIFCVRFAFKMKTCKLNEHQRLDRMSTWLFIAQWAKKKNIFVHAACMAKARHKHVYPE